MEHYVIKPAGEAGEAAVHAGLRAYNRTFVSDTADLSLVVETGMASVSMLQRRLKLGYSRAARLVDQMEEKGVVGPFEGSKPRQVLITKDQWQEMQFKQGMVDAAPEPVPDELEFEGDAIPQSRDLPPFDMED